MSPKVSKEHKEQRRANILEAAKDVFIEHGYEQTTMKHIMDAANVSRGGLYQYFTNKEDVFESLLEEMLGDSVEKAKKLLAEKGLSHWELLLTCLFGEDRTPNNKMHPISATSLEFFITGRKDTRRREYGKMRYYNGVKLFADIIDEGKDCGEFTTSFESETIARTIISYTDGLAVDYAMLPSEDVKLREQSEVFIEYLKAILGVKQ
ncbi:TetR family transcriptional regulator [Pseudalkalibacillus sp. Hm43]|uniref:TetR family transcriptional regulator n=1 Tax=Pseudalkalibacillus sp. Hm43 TaxID=3450742 RepID=UPI003F4213C3